MVVVLKQEGTVLWLRERLKMESVFRYSVNPGDGEDQLDECLINVSSQLAQG